MRDKEGEEEEGEKSKIFTNNITTTKKAMGISTAAVLIALSFVSALSPMTVAFAQATVSCGDTITKSTTLTSDVGPCPDGVNGIIIGADNIILNCNGHTIAGEAQTDNGIQISGHSGVTITNCKVTGFENGFYLVDSSHNTLKTNTASKNSDNGFNIDNSPSNTLTANTASDNNRAGFYLSSGSDHNILKLNTASNNGYGFYLGVDSSSNTLTGNTAGSNRDDGFELDHSSSNTLNTNTARDNGINGFLIGYGSPYNTLTGNTAASNKQEGFVLDSISSTTLNTNTARDNGDDGFYLISGSSSNTLTGNRADTNAYYGYQDFSQGTGTKGTANTYRVNECHGNTEGGSKPTGLCLPQR